MTVIHRAFVCYGQGGAVVGPLLALGDGPKTIAARLRGIGWDVTLHHWDDGAEIAQAVKALPQSARIIIGGTSLGANEAPNTALLCKRFITMIFGVQPSAYGRRNQVPANVERALCFYNPMPLLTLGFGAYAWSRAPGSKATLYTWQSYATHPGDTVPWIHDAIAQHARAIMVR